MELHLSSWVCMGIILLQLLARFADADARVGGSSDQSSCPCLGLDEVPPLSEADQANAIAMGLNTSEYGIGCGAHDKLSSPCTAAGYESLWCRDEFCYVDNLNCDVPLRRSKYFPDSARYFSYETCGFVDQFYRDPKRLDGAVLLGAMEENYRGYQGSRIDDGTYDGFGVIFRHDNVSFYGTTIDLVNMLVNESGIGLKINFTHVPVEVQERSQMYHSSVKANEASMHAACVYATGLSVIDICIGAYTKTPQRMVISNFLELGVTRLYLVVKNEGTTSVGKMIGSVFAPFSASLWGVTFVVIFGLSLLFSLQESNESWRSYFFEAPISTTLDAMYNGMLRFFSQETMLPSNGRKEDGGTWAGRFTLLAIGVQILLTCAAYTANLTNYLVRRSSQLPINGIEEVIAQNKRLCILNLRMNEMNVIYGKGKIIYVPYDTREEILPAIDNGACDCALVNIEVLENSQSKGEHCDKVKVGEPVLDLPWGMPISERYVDPLNTVLTELIVSGKWRSIENLHRPRNMCSVADDDSLETISLDPKHLSGAYVLSAVLVVAGLFASLISKYAKRKYNIDSLEASMSRRLSITGRFRPSSKGCDSPDTPSTITPPHIRNNSTHISISARFRPSRREKKSSSNIDSWPRIKNDVRFEREREFDSSDTLKKVNYEPSLASIKNDVFEDPVDISVFSKRIEDAIVGLTEEVSCLKQDIASIRQRRMQYTAHTEESHTSTEADGLYDSN